MWYKFFKTTLFIPYVQGLMRPTVIGAENIPHTGGAILAANHLSAADTFMLPAMISREVTFPAKAELFRGDRGPASKVVAWFLTSVGQVPMDRSGGRVSADGLRPVLDSLESGRIVGIFPEGTRSPDGRLYKGKTGVARMALEAGVPVLPVGLVNTELVATPVKVPTTKGAVIVIGKPMDFSEYRGATDQKTLRYITDEIMTAIQELTGQEYVDVYGSRAKHGDLVGVDLSDRVKERPNLGSVRPAPPPAAAGAEVPDGN